MKMAAKHLRPGEILILDRLGRSGKSKNPKAQHYNPEAHKAIRKAGATVMMLPPKGHLWNPIELLNGDLKEHHIRPRYGKRRQEMSRETIYRLILKYMKHDAPGRLPGFFAKRARGKHAIEMGLLD